jgi:hypothetical protein
MRYWIAGIIYVAVSAYLLAGVLPPLYGSTAFPPISALQQQLNIYPGGALPKLVVWGGRSFQPYYVGASDHGNGTYTVTVKLR